MFLFFNPIVSVVVDIGYWKGKDAFANPNCSNEKLWLEWEERNSFSLLGAWIDASAVRFYSECLFMLKYGFIIASTSLLSEIGLLPSLLSGLSLFGSAICYLNSGQ